MKPITRLTKKHVRNVIVMCACQALLSACVSPFEINETVARESGFHSILIDTGDFQHRVYDNAVTSRDRLHVYIDGDGTPWINGVVPSQDPTPRNPLVLRMMAQDTGPALYLGRPCYLGAGPREACHEILWTSARYAAPVVDSMASALESLSQSRGNPDLVLIGYSGGGVIATLLSQRIPNVIAVMTIAANLDTQLWTDTFGLLPLVESINPVTLPDIRSDIAYLHLAGALDETVPVAITRPFVDQHGGNLEVYPDFDHSCCWEDNWSTLLERLDSLLIGND